MIFQELSNAVFRFSLRRPGAEIMGGGRSSAPPPPPAGGGKSRGPAGRGHCVSLRISVTSDPEANKFYLLSITCPGLSSAVRIVKFRPVEPKIRGWQYNTLAPPPPPLSRSRYGNISVGRGLTDPFCNGLCAIPVPKNTCVPISNALQTVKVHFRPVSR